MCQRLDPQGAKLLASIPAPSQSQVPTTKYCSKTSLPTSGLLGSTFGDSWSSRSTLPPISCSTLDQSFPPAHSSWPSLWPSHWASLQVSSVIWQWATSRVQFASPHLTESHQLSIALSAECYVLAPRLSKVSGQPCSGLTNSARSVRGCTFNHGSPTRKQRFTRVAVARSAALLSFPPCSSKMYSTLR